MELEKKYTTLESDEFQFYQRSMIISVLLFKKG